VKKAALRAKSVFDRTRSKYYHKSKGLAASEGPTRTASRDSDNAFGNEQERNMR
jgi:hypothetical protein